MSGGGMVQVLVQGEWKDLRPVDGYKTYRSLINFSRSWNGKPTRIINKKGQIVATLEEAQR